MDTKRYLSPKQEDKYGSFPEISSSTNDRNSIVVPPAVTPTHLRRCALYGSVIVATTALLLLVSSSFEELGSGGIIASEAGRIDQAQLNSEHELVKEILSEDLSSTSDVQNKRNAGGHGAGIEMFTGDSNSTTQAVSLKGIRWGIAGLGRISHEFAVALHVTGMHLESVAAGGLPNRARRATQFAATFGVKNAYNSYQQLAEDPKVDIVYIGATNNLHKEIALLMFKHKKHVLCEKPTAQNAEEVEEMIEAAAKAGKFFATNFWNSAFPAVRYTRSAIREGRLGRIIQISGDMGFQAVPNYQERWLSAKLGGGSTMDMGCYLLQFLVMLTEESLMQQEVAGTTDSKQMRPFGSFASQTKHLINANSTKGVLVDNEIELLAAFGQNDPKTNVDIDSAIIVKYKGVTGRFASSLIRPSRFSVDILGEYGMIRIEAPANCPTTAILMSYKDARTTTFEPFPCCVQPVAAEETFSQALPAYPERFLPQQYPRGTGFAYIIEAVAECLRAG
mmetsp:Transcript_9052/g.12638  ORF Transcript_9052/g.12638 Transcript_9052/m.12638 type:complete len:506 (-) Transcript_9052:457-1974(-)